MCGNALTVCMVLLSLIKNVRPTVVTGSPRDLLTVAYQCHFLTVHDHSGPFPYDKTVLGGHELSKKIDIERSL